MQKPGIFPGFFMLWILGLKRMVFLLSLDNNFGS